MGSAVKSVLATEMANRRRYPRVPVNRPARIRVAGGPALPCQLMNVSSRGAALFFSTALAAGTMVRLRMNLPTNGERLIIRLPAVVRQSHLLGESHLIRVEFIKPPLIAVQAILEFMRSRSGTGESAGEPEGARVKPDVALARKIRS